MKIEYLLIFAATILVSYIWPLTAMAQSDCPKMHKLRGLAMAVGNKTADPAPISPDYPFMYQRRLLDASCADPNKDSMDEIKKKIQIMWLKAEDEGHLAINGSTFAIKKGSVIKYALLLQFDEFISDVLRWKVNLNKVDESDQRTALDYLLDELKTFKGTAIESKLEIYYAQLRNAGAKHQSELPKKQP